MPSKKCHVISDVASKKCFQSAVNSGAGAVFGKEKGKRNLVRHCSIVPEINARTLILYALFSCLLLHKLCVHSLKQADNTADWNMYRINVLQRADLHPTVALCVFTGPAKHLLLWEIEL